MRIALVETTPRSKVYPVGLLKIGTWLKSQGHECELFRDAVPTDEGFDEIWCGTLFTYDTNHALKLIREAQDRAPAVKIGGVAASLMPDRYRMTGAEVHVGLLPAVEGLRPDYSLLDHDPEYSIAYTSRGCVRKCSFCMVPKLEPKFEVLPEWVSHLDPSTTKVQFFDNNWMAKPIDAWVADVALLKRLVKEGRITAIDFNQGLDARLITEERADLMQGLPLDPIRLAFDGMQADGAYQKTYSLLAERGFKHFCALVLFNFVDTPQDFYYRIREIVRMGFEYDIRDTSAFPMRYQPIMEADEGRNYIGKHWTAQRKRIYEILKSNSGSFGIVAPHNIHEFEFWYGKTAEEFVALLDYPKAQQLIRMKAGAVRGHRNKRDDRGEEFWATVGS